MDDDIPGSAGELALIPDYGLIDRILTISTYNQVVSSESALIKSGQ